MTTHDPSTEGRLAAGPPPKDTLPSARQLLLSTAVAAGVAAVLLVTVVLPAEYGFDPTNIGRLLGLTSMGTMKREMALAAEVFTAIDPPADGVVPERADTLTVELSPRGDDEVKVAALGDAEISFRWEATGPLDHHLHVDLPQGALTYGKGEGATRDDGRFTAAFGGWHGWYFSNPSDQPVTLTVHLEGRYLEAKSLRASTD